MAGRRNMYLLLLSILNYSVILACILCCVSFSRIFSSLRRRRFFHDGISVRTYYIPSFALGRTFLSKRIRQDPPRQPASTIGKTLSSRCMALVPCVLRACVPCSSCPSASVSLNMAVLYWFSSPSVSSLWKADARERRAWLLCWIRRFLQSSHGFCLLPSLRRCCLCYLFRHTKAGAPISAFLGWASPEGRRLTLREQGRQELSACLPYAHICFHFALSQYGSSAVVMRFIRFVPLDLSSFMHGYLAICALLPYDIHTFSLPCLIYICGLCCR